MDDSERFWRSPQGSLLFERQLTEMLGSVFSGSNARWEHDAGFMRVRRYEGLASPDLSTFVTVGLSHFLLDDPDEAAGASRVELAWTIGRSTHQDLAVAVLVGLANAVLESRTCPELDVLIARIEDFWSHGVCARHHLALIGNHWLGEDAEIRGFYPMRFFEIVALTDQESQLLASDPDGFFRTASQEGLDVTDLQCRIT
jgi:hypothetical protein